MNDLWLSTTELEELTKGEGAWENIQDVLRGAFQRLFAATEAAIGRIEGLELALEAKARESERQTLHIDTLARTLNTVSEELRREKEEDLRKKDAIDSQVIHLSGRLDAVDRLLVNMNNTATSGEALVASVAKADRRLNLLEDEIGHIIEAVEHKLDEDTLNNALVLQKRAFQEALRKRCKTVVVERELLGMKQQLELRINEYSHSTSASIAQLQNDLVIVENRAVQKATAEIDDRLHAALKDLENRVQVTLSELDVQLESKTRETRERGTFALKEVREMTSIVVPAILNDITELRKKLESMRADESQSRLAVPVPLERSDFESLQVVVTQLQSEQNELKRLLDDLVNDLSETVRKDQVHDLEARMADQQRSAVTEIQLLLAETSGKTQANNAEVAKIQEGQAEQIQTLVSQLDEVDQVTRLIGHQLVRVGSQTQVLWEERLSHIDAATEAQHTLGNDDLNSMALHSEGKDKITIDATIGSDSNPTGTNHAKVQLEHDELQAQVQEKLQHYQSLLQFDSSA